ncbi:MAG: recombination protein NinB [Acidovorax defluvii]
MTRTIVTLYNPVQAYQVLKDVWPHIKALLMAGHRLVLEVKPETRSLSQNARLWAILTDVSEQVEWYGRKLTPDDWKHVFTAALSKQDVVPGIEGGFVVLGKATSKMTKSEMAELQTLIEAFGVQRGVKFTAPDWVEE